MKRLIWFLFLGLAMPGCSTAPREPKPVKEQVHEQEQVQAAVPAGKRLFDFWCLPCHEAGSGHAGTQAIGRRLGFDQSVLLQRSGLTPAYVQTIVRNGFQMMPPFRPTEITDTELQLLAEYVATGGHRSEQ